jgi:hypothetical protein
MAGVGKIGLMILLLLLCALAAARLPQNSGYGRCFSLSGWLMNVCHHRSRPRGTQRRSGRHANEPVNALVEQESRGDSHCTVILQQPAVQKAVVSPARILPFISMAKSSPVSDPAFRCTFLI